MTTELVATNKESVRSYHQQLWGNGDVTAIDRHWDPAATVQMSGFAESAVAAVRADFLRYQAAFDQIETSIPTLVGEGAQVVLHWVTTGRHVGSYGVVAATHRRIRMTGIDILTLRDGLIVEGVSVWDGLDVFDQLGALPDLY